MKNILMVFYCLLVSGILFAQKSITLALIEEPIPETQMLRVESAKVEGEFLVLKYLKPRIKKEHIQAAWTGAMLRSLPPQTNVVLYTKEAKKSTKMKLKKVKINMKSILEGQSEYGVKITVNSSSEIYFFKGTIRLEGN